MNLPLSSLDVPMKTFSDDVILTAIFILVSRDLFLYVEQIAMESL